MAYSGGGYVKKGNIVDGYIFNYSALPPANLNTNKIYLVSNSQGTKWLPGSLGGTYYARGFYVSDGTNWIYTSEFPNQASQIQADAGLLEDVFISPKTLENFYKWSTVSSAINFADDEIPSGLLNGVNLIYTVANTPLANSLKLRVNGQWLINGIDFTYTGNTINMLFPLFPNDSLIVDYRY